MGELGEGKGMGTRLAQLRQVYGRSPYFSLKRRQGRFSCYAKRTLFQRPERNRRKYTRPRTDR